MNSVSPRQKIMSSPKSKTITIPIFPLPNVVFFPKTFLPLHIFEPRYRRMVEDAQAGDRQIGLVLLKEGWERDYFGNPEVHQVGCVGEIQFHECLEDGKFDILLYGLSRVRILEFVQEAPYRMARVQLLRDINFDQEHFRVHTETQEFLRLVREYLTELGVEQVEEIYKLQNYSLDSIVNQMASVLDFSTEEKQQLLEMDDLETRFVRLRTLVVKRLFSLKVVRKVKYVPEDPRLN